MMTISPTLADWAAVLALGSGIATVLFGYAQWRMRDSFAAKSAVDAHEDKPEKMERKLATVPTHEDVRRLEQRVASVESSVAVVGSQVAGVRDVVVRVERMVDLLVQDRLAREQASK
jgi:hypothetical protein